MRRWLLQVWPRPVWLLVALLVYAAWVGGLSLLLARFAGFSWQDIRDTIDHTPPAVPLVAAAVYAFYRVCVFHPALRPAYRAWLRHTPWSHRQPLPYGPVHLVPQDAILLGVAVALSVPFYGELSYFVFRAFIVVYLLNLLATLLVTSEWLAAYAVVFGVGAIIPAWRVGWLFYAAAAATYLAAFAGLRRSYRRFPWEHDFAGVFQAGGSGRNSGKAAGQPFYSWPFDLSGPSAGTSNPPFRHSAACCFLAGWWMFAVLTALVLSRGDWNYVSGVFPTVVLTIAAALLRLALYRCFEFVPPLSLAGRLVSGHWIIPGYDQVFVAPLCGIALAVALPNALLSLGANAVVSNSLSLPVALLAVMTLPPSRRRWLLTGSHRVVPGFMGMRPPQMV